MPDPIKSGDRIAATIDALRQQGASERDIETYLVEHEGLRPTDEEPKPGLATKILGTIAATGRDIPGVEAAQAGIRSAVRTGLHKVLPESIAPDAESYREARDNIRGGEDAAPSAARNIARIGGGTLAAFAVPGSAARSGFLYGAGDALGSSDPNTDIKGRIDNAGVQGAMYGGLGALGSAANAVRKLPPGSVGKVGKAMLPAFVKRGIGAVEAIRGAAAPAAEAAIPKAEGFLGNSMDNVLDAVKARGQQNNGVLEMVKDAKPVVPEPAPAPILAPTRHRTQSQFDYFAQQLADRARAAGAGGAPAADEDLTPLLQQSIDQIRKGGRLGSLARVP